MHGMFGVSQSIEEVRRSIDRVADLDVPVLVRGATGTGKELVAAALHRASMRAESKMVAINVAAIPASLAISELFGVKKGAYTGATADKPGYFVQAHGSTLFLDEIGDADDEVQVALLRTLETGEVQAVGGKDFVQVDVRLIAATDADLESKMSSSDFRNPLLQRLAGFEIWLPPLAERKPDICILFAAFIRQEFDAIGESLRYRVLDAESTAFWFALFIRALNYPWTGNVREMRNMARQIAINNRQSMVLSLPPRIHHALFVMDRTQGAKIASDDVGLSPGENAHLAEPAQLSNPAQLSKPTQLRRKPSTVTEVELQAALEAQRWDLKNTAEMLHISRAALYKMIDAHPEIRKAGDIGVLELTEINRRYQGNLDAMVEVLKVSKSALKRRLKELSLS
jgi:two-component system nitrogen regulation response regulator GlnG